MMTPVHDGNALSLDLRRNDQSNRELFPLMMKRF
jgi:hypothetical protein